MVHHVERARVPAWMCSSTSLALGAFMLLLTIDSIIQMCFASSIVAWIEHTVRIQIFRFRVDGSKYHLSGLPRHFILGQIYTTNGAAGTAIVVVVAGILALWLRRRSQHSTGKLATSSRIFYYCWLSLNLPALLLTSVALGYAVAIAKAQAGQTIDVPLAVRLNGSTYSQGTWTPQSWFSAVMGLDLTRDREDLKQHLHIIQWWQYNLILSESERTISFSHPKRIQRMADGRFHPQISSSPARTLRSHLSKNIADLYRILGKTKCSSYM